MQHVTIGCAGWTIAKEHAFHFPGNGEHLERYARLFSAVEINSTFYRLPKAETVVKWKNMVGENFRFAVKLTREITHNTRLTDLTLLPVFLQRMQLLDEKMGPLLVQLPPSLAFDRALSEAFFSSLTEQISGLVVLEPRHVTWFTDEVEALLRHFQIARVAADPAVVTGAALPGGWSGLRYWRLHGSPDMYYSLYDQIFLEYLAQQIESSEAPVWCIFDNTAAGAAVPNGRWLMERIEASRHS